MKKTWIIIFVVFLVAAAGGGYFLAKKLRATSGQSAPVAQTSSPDAMNEFSVLRLFYPVQGKLEMKERKVPGRNRINALAEAIIQEFFKGDGSGGPSPIPANVRLLGIYRDIEQTIYVDLSDEVRREFRGDALSEYLLLKGLHESLISNLQDVQDVKVLVDGREIDTLGGHFYLKFPLKNIVSYEYKGDTKVTDEKQ